MARPQDCIKCVPMTAWTQCDSGYMDTLEARRFVSKPTLIYGVLYDRPPAPFSNWQELLAW